MKRRDFVIKGSLATAGLATSTYAAANIIGMGGANSKVNIGVIGTGSRGRGLIPNINSIENFNVVACADILPFRLDEGLSKVEGQKAKGYSDYRKLLDDKNVDAVLISTPFSTHASIAMDAIDAGKHVYCEKTMAKGYEGIKSLVDKVNNSNKIFQTGHQYHSSRLYTHVVDLIKNGKVGKIQAFECQWNRNGNWRRSVPSPELERIINWRMYREYSGGLVAELCSHQLDFANWVLDATPNKVAGFGSVDYWKDGRETYDNIHLIYDYPDGVKAKFTCLTANSKDDYQIKVLGDKGTIILGYAKAWFYPEGKFNKKIGDLDGVSGATVSWDEGKGIPIKVEHIEPSKQALIDFKNSIVNNDSPVSNLATGAKAAICVQMGLDAMYDQKIVEWDPSFNKLF
ncbi:Gfo/Idh/MocA family oxidoreductase [Reichenbachiella carrageenanivorans]|uniref:Gfo/Idh/MocA family oxidoreductase n=1 Tax=Reichenbachiella carrageenanivorans TaxID=2979869 RepID=A0ABY6D242_9BACT|nr:Gfo/Idh/MocA family oxidoreductase [Reichenbachiella carrageenanivorans]UXX79819.1 Gfo/Idh/MocA family oxidoreductase [Reichenbachiella carrageenanivorans]